jgi:hypothetical protein
VGFIHARRDDPDSVGLMHYHNAHRWSGGGSPSHTLLSGILCDYYLTGDRRQMEVALELGEWIVSHQEKAGILSCRHGTLHREFTGPLWSLLELYQATWDERFGQLAHRSLNWMLQAFGEPPEYPVSIYTRGLRGDEALVEPAVWPTGNARELYYLYSIAWRLFPSERLSKRILAEADFYLWEGMVDNYLTADQARRQLGERSRLWAVDEKFYWTDWAANMPDYETGAVCLAWEITADPLYAAYARYRVEQTWPRQVQRCRHDADFRFTWLWFGNYIPRLACIVAEAMDRDPDALAAAERTWKQKRAEMGNDVYEGPGIDHQVDTMDALGVITSRPPADLPRQGPTRRYEPKRNLGPLPVDDPQSV